MCGDHRCHEGITACMGPNGCNGHGALSPKGGKYRQKRTAPLPTWAVAHHECNGTGLVQCGCKPKLTTVERKTLKGAAWKANEQRWSTHAGALIGKPAPAPRPKPAVVATTRPATKPATRRATRKAGTAEVKPAA